LGRGKFGISHRLMAVARLVIAGKPMADIGTDHGYLPLWLVLNGVVPKALACDVNKGPVELAARNTSHRPEIQVRRGDGLSCLTPNEVTTVTICGMGGKAMSGILERSPHVVSKLTRVVLAPNQGVVGLRRWLQGAGWQAVAGDIVHENGLFYPVMAWERGDGGHGVSVSPLSDAEALVGPFVLASGGPVLRLYVSHLISNLELQLRRIGTAAPEKSKRLREELSVLHAI